MAENNLLKRFLQNNISQTFIAIFGIIGTAITIYAFLQEKKANVRYELLSNINVLDFNANVNKLNVVYDSTNLRETKENIRIYTIKIINNGEQTLLNNYYDKNDPLGLKIINAKIIEKPQVIEASNNYVRKNIKILAYKTDNFIFNPIILEKGEYYIIRFLVLYKTDLTPQLIPIGKIADQRNIEIINSSDIKSKEPFIEQTYFGNIWVQLLRLVSYFFVGLLIILLVLLLSEKIDNIISKNNRKKFLNEFRKRNDYSYAKIDDTIFNRYLMDDYYLLAKMYRILRNEDLLNDKYEKSVEGLKNKEYRRIDSNRRISYFSEDYHIINEMINDGIVFKEGERLSINQPMKDTLDKFVAFLKSKNKFRSGRSLRFAQSIIQEDDSV